MCLRKKTNTCENKKSFTNKKEGDLPAAGGPRSPIGPIVPAVPCVQIQGQKLYR